MSWSSSLVLPEGVDLGDHVVATYSLRANPDLDIQQAAAGVADLQSTGTWVSLAQETSTIRERHAASVISLWEVPDHELQDPRVGESRHWVFQIAYPAHNIGNQIPLLLATVYGEGASIGGLRLLDLHLPRSFVDAFPGPRFGLDGIRKLVGAGRRPLLITMIKPAIGLTPKESADVFLQAALGGADGVKDDELIVDHPWSRLVDRVREHERAAQIAFEQTGHRTLYFVNITDRPDRLVENAHRVVEAGASALLVDFVTVGVAALSSLAEDPAVDVPIMGHLAFAGAMYAASSTGLSSHLILGKLPRLCGADVVVYPSPYGTLDFSRSHHLRVAQALTARLYDVATAVPMPGGGLHPGLLPQLVGDLGLDFAAGAGGAVHGHPMGSAGGAAAMRQAIDATVGGISLAEAAGRHRELELALSTWPIDDPPGE